MKLEQLQKASDIAAILMVFSVTGTTSSFAPKYIMPLTGLESGFLYYLAYFILITPIYLVLLMIVAFLFGKISYFYEKQKKILRWISGKKSKPKAE